MLWVQTALAALTVALVVAARRGVARVPRVWWDPLTAALTAAWSAGFALALSWVLAELGELRLHDEHLAAMAAFSAIVAWPVTLVPVRARGAATAGLGLLLVALVWADVLHARFFGSVLSMGDVLAAGQTWAVRGSVGEALRAADAGLLLPAAAALAWAFWPRPTPPPTGRRQRLALLAVVSLTTAAATLPAWRRVEAYLASAESWHVFTTSYWVAGLGFVGAHVYDVARTMRERRSETSDGELRQIAERLRTRAAAAPPAGELFGAARGANVLLIQLEAAQQWLLGARVRGEEVTPFLNRLRDESLAFPYVFAQAAGGSTSDSELVVLNSLLPLGKGAAVFRRPTNTFVTLPQRLAAAGYATAAAHAGARGFWNRGVVFPRWGIEALWFGEDLGAAPRDGLGDGPFYAQVLPRLDALPRPFFALLISLSAHHPYTRRDGPVALPLGALAGSLLGRYLTVSRYADGALAELFAGLARAGRLDDTLIVVYGDHDSRITVKPGDRARFAAELAGEELDVTLLASRDPRLRRVPLLIRLPGGAHAGRVETIGGQLDIAPTVLHLLGLPAPPVFLGRSLLTSEGGFAAAVDGSAYGAGLACVGPARPRACAGCTAFPPAPGPAATDAAACAALRARAAEAAALSERILLGDLAARLAVELGGEQEHADDAEQADEVQVVGEGVPGEEEEQQVEERAAEGVRHEAAGAHPGQAGER